MLTVDAELPKETMFKLIDDYLLNNYNLENKSRKYS